MKIFLVLLAVFLLIFLAVLITYAPIIWSRFRIRTVKRALETEIDALDDVFKSSCVINTNCLGKGASQNSGTRFADVIKNLDVAVDSSKVLIENMLIMRD